MRGESELVQEESKPEKAAATSAVEAGSSACHADTVKILPSWDIFKTDFLEQVQAKFLVCTLGPFLSREHAASDEHINCLPKLVVIIKDARIEEVV